MLSSCNIHCVVFGTRTASSRLARIGTKLHINLLCCFGRGAIPDYEQPVVMKRENPTVENFCNRLHKHILEKFKYALVWGSSVKHQPQRVGLEHLLMDEDVVQIVKK